MTKQPIAQAPIGVIGLGLFGTALAERLITGGYPTVVWNRSRKKADALIAAGAKSSEDPLAKCDVVVISLYTTEVVEEVLGQMKTGLWSGQILIDTTTADPSQTTALGSP